ncbi:hypothetical protein [Alicycliphilus denitrificans]|uniref:hypothetical protein n=1 Tax=Alicycliphilus denitrificans TaxID=179636 RepID=UPI003A802EAF
MGHNVFRTDFSIAFGGFKQPGTGREGLAEGLDAYLESKTVILHGRPSHLQGGPRQAGFKPNRPPALFHQAPAAHLSIVITSHASSGEMARIRQR